MEHIFKYYMDKWDFRVNFSIWPMEPWKKGDIIKNKMNVLAPLCYYCHLLKKNILLTPILP